MLHTTHQGHMISLVFEGDTSRALGADMGALGCVVGVGGSVSTIRWLVVGPGGRVQQCGGWGRVPGGRGGRVRCWGVISRYVLTLYCVVYLLLHLLCPISACIVLNPEPACKLRLQLFLFINSLKQFLWVYVYVYLWIVL